MPKKAHSIPFTPLAHAIMESGHEIVEASRPRIHYCRLCWQLVPTKATVTWLKQHRCTGKPSPPAKGPGTKIHQTHRMAFFKEAGAYWACSKCGSTTGRTPRKLQAGCLGRPTKEAQRALARMQQGRTPWRSQHSQPGNSLHETNACSGWEANQNFLAAMRRRNR